MWTYLEQETLFQQSLNDSFRRAVCATASPHDASVTLTPAIRSLPQRYLSEIWELLHNYEHSTDDLEDPYSTHDFGAIEHPICGTIFWHIETLDSSFDTSLNALKAGESPQRRLTLMLATER